MTQISEVITLDEGANVRRTADGFLVAEPRVARSGVQLYKGWEVGRPDMATVRLMRPESVVFDKRSLQSYAHRPITNGHPAEPVNADNWRDHSVGHVGGEVMRDGDFIRVPIVLMDAATIDAVESGEANQLSLGYQMALDWEAGDGYDAKVTSIVANHLAVVENARGGPNLRIGDDDMAGQQNARDFLIPGGGISSVVVDGVSVDVTSAALPIIQRYQKDTDEKLNAAAVAQTELQTANDSLKRDVETKDAEIATLKQQLEESKLSDAKLDELVKDRAAVVAVAQTVLGKDGLDGSTAELRKKVVLAKLGDRAADWNDDQIMASFNTLDLQGAQTAQTKQAPSGNVVNFNLQPTGDGNDARAKAMEGYNSYLADSWKKGVSEDERKGA